MAALKACFKLKTAKLFVKNKKTNTTFLPLLKMEERNAKCVGLQQEGIKEALSCRRVDCEG